MRVLFVVLVAFVSAVYPNDFFGNITQEIDGDCTDFLPALSYSLLPSSPNSVMLKWAHGSSGNCSRFKAIVNDEVVLTSNINDTVLPAVDLYCADGVKIIDIISREVVQTYGVPGPVLDLTIASSRNSITVTWSPPEDPSCVTGYVILNNEESIPVSASTLTYTFSNLQYCDAYEVQVAATSDTDTGEFSSVSKEIPAPSPLGAVQNFKLNVLDGILNATWDPPSNAGNCVSKYVVAMWNQNQNTKDYETNLTYYEFTPLIGCMVYNVQVKPWVNQSMEGNTLLLDADVGNQVTSPPAITGHSANQTWAAITLTVQSYLDNMCDILEVRVECTALEEENGDYYWIIRDVEGYIDITEHSQSRPPVTVNVTDMSEFTNYTCYGVVVNTGGESNNSAPIKFQTGEGAPSEPLLIEITNITSNEFYVTWEEPSKIPGILQSYKLIFEPAEAHHYIPEECLKADQFEVEVDADTIDYFFESGLPNYLYTVKINASTRAGFGPENTAEVSTLTAIPGSPRDIGSIFQIEEIVDYNVKAIISWVLPCDTNGELVTFDGSVNATSTVDPSETYYFTFSVPRNDPIENIDYTYIVTNINASFFYTISVWTVLDDDSISEAEILELTSPDGYPSAPRIEEATDITESTFDINWTEPEIKNGLILSYYLTVRSIGPLYAVPTEDCEINTDSFSVELDADILSYTISDAQPYYNYSITARAATSAGYGLESDAVSVVTSESVPEMPKNLSLDPEVKDLVNYDVEASINWFLPCKTNGELNHFHISINSTALGSEDTFWEEKTLDPTLDFVYKFVYSTIQAGSSYIFTVKAVLTSGLEGEVDTVEYEAPEGYPSAPIIQDPTSTDETSFDVSWIEPEVKNGLLRHYNLTIQSKGPLYVVPTEDCEIDTISFWVEFDAEVSSYSMSDAQPYYNYSITARAATSAGYGGESEVTFVTPESVPEKPRRLTLKSTEKNLVDYDVEASINWYLPCKTNGELSFFHVSINYTAPESTDSSWEETTMDPTSDLTYSLTYSSIQPGYNYIFAVKAVLASGLEGEVDTVEFRAPEGYPSEPFIEEVSNPQQKYFEITWQEPAIKNGILRNYSIIVTSVGPLYTLPDDEECSSDTNTYNYYVNSDVTTFNFTEALPYHRYTVVITAATSAGFGAESNRIVVITAEAEPEEVRNLTYTVGHSNTEVYSAELTVEFSPPCNTFGTFVSFEFNLTGQRPGYESHIINANYEEPTEIIVNDLKPEYTYALEVTVKAEHFDSSTTSQSFVSPSGVPLDVEINLPEPAVDGTNVTFNMAYPLFDETNGNVVYYALIVSQQNLTSSYGFWDGTAETWPSVESRKRFIRADTSAPYQATPMFWNPFSENGVTNITFELGTSECYDDGFCNKELEPDVLYNILVRGFTTSAYRDTSHLQFQFESPARGLGKLALILIIVFSILGAILLAVFIFVLWKRRNGWAAKKPSLLREHDAPPTIPVEQFPEHYTDIKENYNKLKVEYTLLGTKTSEFTATSAVAELPENKSKNRYTNILPFDDTRVVLTSTDTNDNYSTYINASYIKGFSREKEYIATQGPLQSTCLDFWRMVLQENITVIAMVAQFFEQNKEKCYKYFPQKNENMDVGDGIELRCTTELNFGTYIVRTFLLQKDTEKHTIKHLQFVEWPDFGCPTLTDSILQFCQLMRNNQKELGGTILVHCSAGVGRSGTLIAVDILLQAISTNTDIDIFNTVLNLRKQRPNMVQTEKQYMYIHTCVRDAILNPPKVEDKIENAEPIYENVSLISDHNSETGTPKRSIFM